MNRITPYRNSSVDRWQRKTQLATGAAAVKGRFQAFNQVNFSDCSFVSIALAIVKCFIIPTNRISFLIIQSISQQLTSALRNPTQLIASIRSSKSKDQVLIVSEALHHPYVYLVCVVLMDN